MGDLNEMLVLNTPLPQAIFWFVVGYGVHSFVCLIREIKRKENGNG